MKYSYKYIVCTKDIVGGAPRINGRRIEVQHVIWAVLNYKDNLAEYLNDFELSIPQIREAIRYCASQQCEIDKPGRGCNYCTKIFNNEIDAINEIGDEYKPYWHEAKNIIKSDLFNNVEFEYVDDQFIQNQFVKNLKSEFSLIKKEIDSEEGIHMILGVFANYTNVQIINSNYDELKRIFAFIDEHIDLVDNSTNNAMYVSFLELLDMDGDHENHIKARGILSDKRREEYLKLRMN